MQPTELSFLSPPAQRSQCRYFNVERLTDWAIKLLNSPGKTLLELVPNSEPYTIHQKIIDKLGWLVDYQSALIHCHQMVTLTRSIETQLKQSGLNHQVLNHLQENNFTFADSSLKDFPKKIFDYLVAQSNDIRDEETFERNFRCHRITFWKV